MKIITITYALAFRDDQEATLDGVQDVFAAAIEGCEAEIISCTSASIRPVAVDDPELFDNTPEEAEEAQGDWNATVCEQPEFQVRDNGPDGRRARP